MSLSDATNSRCSRCGTALEGGGCLRCLLSESEQISPMGRRPLWEESEEIDNCLEVIGEFALIRPLGRGGMGEVFLARQLATGRPVALKLLSSQVDRARVDREAAALAALAHPNIVGIVQRGEHQGSSYLVMDYVEGGTLAERMVSAPLSSREAARVLCSVARALAHAHGKGVLHRDLKPQNILLDLSGEPHLTDFGLAHLDSQPTLTQTQSVLGTPGYSAPEQLDPTLGPVSASTDVYGLGATLYHLLTTTPPFRGETVQQTCHQVLSADAVPPRRLNPAIPIDLEVICLACLEKSPVRRYGSANELADELDRWLEHRPILRRPAGPVERLLRWAQRHPSLAALSAITALVTCLGMGGVLWQWSLTRDANRQLEAEVSRARRELAEQHFRSGDTPEALRVLSRHLRDQPKDTFTAQRLWAAVARRAWALPHLTVQVPELIASGLIHPDEEQLLLLTATAVTSPSFDLQVHQPRLGRRTMEPSSVGGQRGNWGFSPNADAFVTLFEKRLQVWDPQTWKPIALHPSPAPTLLDFSWHPTRPLLFWGEGSNVLGARVAHTPDRNVEEPMRFLSAHAITTFGLSAEGTVLTIGDAQGTLRTWDVTSAKLTLELKIADSPLQTVAMLQSPPRVLATYEPSPTPHRPGRRRPEPTTGLWEWPSGRAIAFFTNSTLTSASLNTNWVMLQSGTDLQLVETRHGIRIKEWKSTVSPGFTMDGQYLGLVEDQSRFTWVSMRTLQAVGEPVRYPWPLELPSFASKSSKTLIPTSRGDATVWNAPRTNSIPLALGTNVTQFTTHPSESKILMAEGHDVLWVDDVNHRGPLASLPGPTHSLSISPRGNWVAVGGDRGRLSLLEASSLRLAWECSAGTNAISQVAFDAEGTRLAGGTLGGILYQWSTGTTNPIPVAMDLTQGAPQVYGRHEVHAIRYHPHDPKLAVACGNGLVYLIEAGSTNILHRLPHDDVPVFDLRFNRDGSRFAVASFRGYAQVYDTGSGRPVGPKLSHDSSVMSLDFSPDGTLLLTGSDDHRARVWNVATGRVLASAQGHSRTVFRSLFSADGRRFLTSSSDGSARIWETATGLPLDEPLPHGWKSRAPAAWRGPDTIALLAPGKSVLLYGLPKFPTPAPVWLSTLGDALSGLATSKSPAEELLRLKSDLHSLPKPTAWEAWGMSFFAP